MEKYSKELLNAAHKASIFCKEHIEASEICGCFNCLYIFEPKEIIEWVDESNPKGKTPLCPKCAIDSVIGSASGFPVSDIVFLRAMEQLYFH